MLQTYNIACTHSGLRGQAKCNANCASAWLWTSPGCRGQTCLSYLSVISAAAAWFWPPPQASGHHLRPLHLFMVALDANFADAVQNLFRIDSKPVHAAALLQPSVAVISSSHQQPSAAISPATHLTHQSSSCQWLSDLIFTIFGHFFIRTLFTLDHINSHSSSSQMLRVGATTAKQIYRHKTLASGHRALLGPPRAAALMASRADPCSLSNFQVQCLQSTLACVMTLPFGHHLPLQPASSPH